MIKLRDKNYNILFLDTNVIRDIICNKQNIQQALSFHFFNTINYLPCISIYSIFEIKIHTKIYQKFISTFNCFPFLMFLPTPFIVKEEYKSYLNKSIVSINNQMAYAFSSSSTKSDYQLSEITENIFSNKKINNDLCCFANNLDNIIKIWETKRRKIAPNKRKESYYWPQENKIITKDLNVRKINNIAKKDITYFPSLRMMEYTHFRKLYSNSASLTKNDVIDIEISSCFPYADVIITEKFQYDVINSAKKKISQMRNIIAHKVSDFYN